MRKKVLFDRLSVRQDLNYDLIFFHFKLILFKNEGQTMYYVNIC